MRIAIAGTGYVGLLTGLAFARGGNAVTFVDPDPRRLAAVASGKPPFHEPGLPSLMQEAARNVSVASQLPDAVAQADFTFLCVGTPQAPDGSTDLSDLRQAARQVGEGLRAAPRGHTVVVKSTVLPGTLEDVVIPALEEASGQAEGEGFQAASNPEFLREGSAVADALGPDRIVVGARRPATAQHVLGLYAALAAPKLAVAPATAEMIKYAANTFLAVRVALANEFANLCSRTGTDWMAVAQGIGLDRRIGPEFLRAGVGFGGSCFPKDLAAVAHLARELGAPLTLAQAALEGNRRQHLEAVRLLEEEVGGLRGRTIALLGLAFKADTDDVRESRARPLWEHLAAAGAAVRCHDPLAGPNFQRLVPQANVVADLEAALRGADAALIQTEWQGYRDLDPAWLRGLMASPVIVDGRPTPASRPLRAAGLRYRAIGLGTSPGAATS